MGSSLPCIERKDGDLPTQAKPGRPNFRQRSHYGESPEYVTSGGFRLVKLKASSLDAFFQSSVKDQLLYRYHTSLLSQWPGEDTALLITELGEDTSRYTVIPFNCFGTSAEILSSLQHALIRYHHVRKLELIGCAGGSPGLYFLFRHCPEAQPSPVIQELPLSTTALELETLLNSLSSQSLRYHLAITTSSSLFLVLTPYSAPGAYIVLDIGPFLLPVITESLTKNAKNDKMTLMGLVTSPTSAMFVYLYCNKPT